MSRTLAETIALVVQHVEDLGSLATELRSDSRHVTLQDLYSLENKIMSAISDFAAAQTAFNDREDAAVAGLTADVASLNAQILALQNSPGAITPADQALLDGLQARGQTIATKLEALDALTPPVVPVVPPGV